MTTTDDLIHHTRHSFALHCRYCGRGEMVGVEFSTIGDGPDVASTVQARCLICGGPSIVELHTNPPSAKVVA